MYRDAVGTLLLASILSRHAAAHIHRNQEGSNKDRIHSSVAKGSDVFCVRSVGGIKRGNNNFRTVIMRQPLREKEFITEGVVVGR